MMLWIKIEVTDTYVHLIFKHKNVNIVNFVYNGKTGSDELPTFLTKWRSCKTESEYIVEILLFFN